MCYAPGDEYSPMDARFLKKLLRLYANSDVLLKSRRFGEGLWPLDPAVGQVLHTLIRTHGLSRGLEVGAGIGYSTAWFVEAFRATKGSLISLEYFLPKVAQWERHMNYIFSEQFEQVVQLIPSEFTKWLTKAGPGKFDFVFFDQRKMDYLPHLKLLLPKLKKGAFITADNVVSHAHECQDYLDFVKKDRRFESFTLQLGQGLEITRYL